MFGKSTEEGICCRRVCCLLKQLERPQERDVTLLCHSSQAHCSEHSKNDGACLSAKKEIKVDRVLLTNKWSAKCPHVNESPFIWTRGVCPCPGSFSVLLSMWIICRLIHESYSSEYLKIQQGLPPLIPPKKKRFVFGLQTMSFKTRR